jgi:hypothetical protein
VETPAALATCFMVARLLVFKLGTSWYQVSTIVIVPDNDNIVTNPGGFVKWFYYFVCEWIRSGSNPAESAKTGLENDISSLIITQIPYL